MQDHTNNENRNAVSGWEDDGGAPRSDAAHRIHNARAAGDRRRPVAEHLDVSHQSDTRGEHRYDAVHLTGAEQRARQERDDLKQRLAGRGTRRVP
jgi:hypothetical protein